MLAGEGSIYLKVKQGLDLFLKHEYNKMSSEDESDDKKPPDSKVEKKIADPDQVQVRL